MNLHKVISQCSSLFLNHPVLSIYCLHFHSLVLSVGTFQAVRRWTIPTSRLALPCWWGALNQDQPTYQGNYIVPPLTDPDHIKSTLSPIPLSLTYLLTLTHTHTHTQHLQASQYSWLCRPCTLDEGGPRPLQYANPSSHHNCSSPQVNCVWHSLNLRAHHINDSAMHVMGWETKTLLPCTGQFLVIKSRLPTGGTGYFPRLSLSSPPTTLSTR